MAVSILIYTVLKIIKGNASFFHSATKTIVDHLKENPQLRKPKYLIQNGAFDEEETIENSTMPTTAHHHIPLYQHVDNQSSK